jgi:phosphoenolpyruvate carboxylase
LGKASRFVVAHHQILLINRLFELFPALVLPLELREDAGLIASALNDAQAPIRKMLNEVSLLANGYEVSHYVRGLIVSHCDSASDMSNAGELIWRACRMRKLPVIPLFESRGALRSSKKILNEWLKNPANLNQVQNQWFGKLEVMLGYSDSAKEMGVLPSRYLIRASMFEIESAAKGQKLKARFFHGSGGSVERGGGSLKEQISWWSNSAIGWPKLTIQGESIQRTFATKEILNSQCMHMSNEARLRRGRKAKAETSPILEKMVTGVESSYRNFIENTDLLNHCLQATPYHYLNILKIGSRPTKRPSSVASVESLRAIPWILCWTQTRLLLPAWWGVGSAWQSFSAAEKQQLKDLWTGDPFFSSFVKTLGYTLAKVEMNVWRRYLIAAHGKEGGAKLFEPFDGEFKKAVRFVREVSQSKLLIAHRPWLEESIRLRSPYIHILNLLQIMAMRDHDEKLLKETLVGIACGMLTTG